VIPINDLTRGIANSEEVAQALSRVLRSGSWIHGPEHKAFEIELSEYLVADYVFGVASGTDALEIALRAVGCKRGSKVITVANAGGYTSVASASIGCEVIYCDVDPVKLVLDPECLAPLLSEDITAVVITHLFGNVAPVRAIKEMCDVYGIFVIEDCAQAIGATELGDRVGTIGHIGTFSFYPTKNLGAIGDGGALSTNDPEIAQRITQLRQYGWTSKYKIDIPGGINSRLDEIQAAVLRISLPKLDLINQRRREIVRCYSNAVQNSRLRLITSILPESAPHLAVLLLPEEISRDDFRKFMKVSGIGTDIHYPLLDNEQIGLNTDNSTSFIPISQSSVKRLVSIPLFPELNRAEVNQISRSLANFSQRF
jgi:aminotransferase EvaB